MNLTEFMVLVVDDDQGLVRLMRKALERAGCRTSSAYSGEEALQWLSGNRANLLLLDLKLPDIDGKELIGRLSERRLTTPFIIITGQGDERVAVEMMKRGAVDYLVKDAEFLQFLAPVVTRAAAKLQIEQRLAEVEQQIRLIRTALEQAQDAVLITRAAASDPEIVFANPAFSNLTGLHPEEVIGKSMSQLARIFGDWEQLHPCLNEGRDLFTETVIHSLQTGSRQVEWRSTPVRDAAGIITHCISIQRDVTERKRLEKEILEISDCEQRRIGQDLHDGLGQHLTGIELLCQVLEQSLERKTLPEAEQAARISKYVREAISQTRQLARGLSPVELDADGLRTALHNLANQTSELFGIRCEVVMEDALRISNNTTATQLYRIVQEALSNACKHSGACHVTISSASLDAGHWRLSIADNGSGFIEENTRGSGLGLRIMRYRAGMIGARLAINSSAKGTTLTCDIKKDL
jgi:PAS domain S-box-containing protein